MKDPIVEEVRKHRMEYTRRFHGDLAAICADLQRVQAASGHKVVRLSPKKPRVPNKMPPWARRSGFGRRPRSEGEAHRRPMRQARATPACGESRPSLRVAPEAGVFWAKSPSCA
jgi:hypothetical protein